jgi:hypothetical protein
MDIKGGKQMICPTCHVDSDDDYWDEYEIQASKENGGYHRYKESVHITLYICPKCKAVRGF